MGEPVNIIKYAKVLIEDKDFLNNWEQVSDALGIPARDLYSMNNKVINCNATMYDVAKWMLESWLGRKSGEIATVENLIQILERENLPSAADLLRDFSKRNDANQDLDQVENEGDP
ncbi:uncharacterized protein LOC110856288 [Folsomia candida]|uniref:Death domain-containing protein n=1 Tax=Folsomia candida TaxID=158441 RepID=A0A226DQZ5_FOLCA|nr:uncharacterized protein LOC110856288 [Folsomia candida]OXA46626.1 hypothetical protein Fcan01_18801 [Folsomia candida]